MSEGDLEVPSQSPLKHLKMMLKRRLSITAKRKLKRYFNVLAGWLLTNTGRSGEASVPETVSAATGLKAGDLVRVRSREEIQLTLDVWGDLKGCRFLPEMEQYYDTTQRVLKPVERFVDERDYRVKKSKGVVLLEGVICQGTVDFGRCDRSCFFFWREEWLARID
jgi:hypothetical protein